MVRPAAGVGAAVACGGWRGAGGLATGHQLRRFFSNAAHVCDCADSLTKSPGLSSASQASRIVAQDAGECRAFVQFLSGRMRVRPKPSHVSASRIPILLRCIVFSAKQHLGAQALSKAALLGPGVSPEVLWCASE